MAVEAVGVRLRRDSIARAMFVFTLFVRVSGMSKLSDSDFARRSPTSGRFGRSPTSPDDFFRQDERPGARHFVWNVLRKPLGAAPVGEIYTTRRRRRKTLFAGVGRGARSGVRPCQSILEATVCIVSTMSTAMGG